MLRTRLIRRRGEGNRVLCDKAANKKRILRLSTLTFFIVNETCTSIDRTFWGISFYDHADKGDSIEMFMMGNGENAQKVFSLKNEKVEKVDRLMTFQINPSRPAARPRHALFTLESIFSIGIYDRFAWIFRTILAHKKSLSNAKLFFGWKKKGFLGKRNWMFNEHCGWVNDVKKVKHTTLGNMFIYGHLNQKCVLCAIGIDSFFVCFLISSR